MHATTRATFTSRARFSTTFLATPLANFLTPFHDGQCPSSSKATGFEAANAPQRGQSVPSVAQGLG